MPLATHLGTQSAIYPEERQRRTTVRPHPSSDWYRLGVRQRNHRPQLHHQTLSLRLLQTSLCLWLGSYPYVLESSLFTPAPLLYTTHENIVVLPSGATHYTTRRQSRCSRSRQCGRLRTLIPVPMYLMYPSFAYP